MGPCRIYTSVAKMEFCVFAVLQGVTLCSDSVKLYLKIRHIRSYIVSAPAIFVNKKVLHNELQK